MFNSAIVFKDGHCFYQQRPISKSNKGLYIRILSAGLCGTDIQILKGERHEITDVIGHEGIGIITEHNSFGASSFYPGQKVIINPTDVNDPKFLLGHNIPGLFQKYVYIPNESVKNGVVIPVDENIPNELAPLIEPVAVALTALDVVKKITPQKLVIVGGGIIGNIIGIISQLKNLKTRTVVIHHNEHSLYFSKKRLLPNVTHLIDDKDIYNSLFQEKTAVFVATPRSATNIVTSRVLENLKSHSIVDVIGGIDKNVLVNNKSSSKLLRIRSCNVCLNEGGAQYLPVYPEYILNKKIVGSYITSHRGVSTSALVDAKAMISNYKLIFIKLITHTIVYDDFSQFLNELICSKTRVIDGNYVLKAVMLNKMESL